MALLSRVCMTHPEEPRAAESGLRLPNETECSFGDFMLRNTPYCHYCEVVIKGSSTAYRGPVSGKSGLEMDLNALFTLSTIVFSLVKNTSGLHRISKKPAPLGLGEYDGFTSCIQ